MTQSFVLVRTISVGFRSGDTLAKESVKLNVLAILGSPILLYNLAPFPGRKQRAQILYSGYI